MCDVTADSGWIGSYQELLPAILANFVYTEIELLNQPVFVVIMHPAAGTIIFVFCKFNLSVLMPVDSM